jgi:hypothetical protein
MNHDDRAPLPLAFDNPAFLIGVTGYMDLHACDVESLEKRVHLIFRFLHHGARFRHEAYDQRALSDVLVEELIPPHCNSQQRQMLRLQYQRALSSWPGLADTPIVVLCALAPGADSLVAKIALKEEFRNRGFHVRAALPFPFELYREASTFVRSDGSAEDNLRRQSAFDQLVKEIGPRNAVAVRLHEDLGLKPDELLKKYRADLNVKGRRHDRYYAAGEYLTVCTHLMLAVWSGEREPTRAGTSAVVEARLRGPEPGLLPTSSGLALPHGGPALHLLARRAGKTFPDPSLPQLRWLHPYGSVGKLPENEHPQAAPDEPPPASSTIIGKSQLEHASLQQNRLAMFCRIADNLESFNAASLKTANDPKREFRDRLTYAEPGGRKKSLVQALEREAGDFSRSLERVSNRRFRAKEVRSHFGNRSDWILWIMFAATFAAATLTHAFAHWHLTTPETAAGASANSKPATTAALAVQGEHSGKSSHTSTRTDSGIEKDAASKHVSPEEHDRHEHHYSLLRNVIGVTAIVSACVALFGFAIQNPKRHAERSHDYRAMAEGLRVQFYWNLAGLGRSVSANYMQRQRSELDWIRGAIRTSSFPYEWWCERFSELSRPLKIAALRCVQHGWIEEQRKYFERTYHKHDHELHFWHKLGRVAALAGVCTFLVWLGCACSKQFLILVTERWDVRLGMIAVPLLVAAGAWAIFRRIVPVEESVAHHEREHLRNLVQRLIPPPPKKNNAEVESWRLKSITLGAADCWRYAWRVVVTLVELVLLVAVALVPSFHRTPATAASYPWRLAGLFGRFAAHIPLSLFLAALVLCVSIGLGDLWGWFPNAENLGIIFGGVLLLAGALLVAWAEKKLHSELAYQYNTMAALFASASLRMSAEVERLADPTISQEDFERALIETQEFLFALGKESLDENAEWLLLHRARPMEPVMAG